MIESWWFIRVKTHLKCLFQHYRLNAGSLCLSCTHTHTHTHTLHTRLSLPTYCIFLLCFYCFTHNRAELSFQTVCFKVESALLLKKERLMCWDDSYGDHTSFHHLTCVCLSCCHFSPIYSAVLLTYQLYFVCRVCCDLWACCVQLECDWMFQSTAV